MARMITVALAAGLLLAGPAAARADDDGQAKNTTQTSGTTTRTPTGSTERTDVNHGAGSGTGTMPPAGNSGETGK